jgi:hypothetical protein
MTIAAAKWPVEAIARPALSSTTTRNRTGRA